MLVYIRVSDIENIMCDVTKDDVAEHLQASGADNLRHVLLLSCVRLVRLCLLEGSLSLFSTGVCTTWGRVSVVLFPAVCLWLTF